PSRPRTHLLRGFDNQKLRGLVGRLSGKPHPFLLVEDPRAVDNHLHLLGDERAAVEAQAADGIMHVRYAVHAIVVLAFGLAALGAGPHSVTSSSGTTCITGPAGAARVMVVMVIVGTNRVTLLNIFDRTNLIRPSNGIGVFQAAYGPRITVYNALTIPLPQL